MTKEAEVNPGAPCRTATEVNTANRRTWQGCPTAMANTAATGQPSEPKNAVDNLQEEGGAADMAQKLGPTL